MMDQDQAKMGYDEQENEWWKGEKERSWIVPSSSGERWTRVAFNWSRPVVEEDQNLRQGTSNTRKVDDGGVDSKAPRSFGVATTIKICVSKSTISKPPFPRFIEEIEAYEEHRGDQDGSSPPPSPPTIL